MAYEEFRIAPKSSLLHKIDKMELIARDLSHNLEVIEDYQMHVGNIPTSATLPSTIDKSEQECDMWMDIPYKEYCYHKMSLLIQIIAFRFLQFM